MQYMWKYYSIFAKIIVPVIFFIEIHIKYQYQHLVNMFLYNPAVPKIETFI